MIFYSLDIRLVVSYQLFMTRLKDCLILAKREYITKTDRVYYSMIIMCIIINLN
jgi:hypothetical protein